MEASTPSEATGTVYRISWVAYLKPVGISLFVWFLGFGAFAKANIWSAVLWTVAVGLFVAYRVMMLRSVQLYTDNDGVWVFRGIFPWNKGVSGVKWRDLEDAVYFPNFMSWALKSYTVRVGHRFTKSSEIVLANIAKGDAAVLHINAEHKRALAGLIAQ